VAACLTALKPQAGRDAINTQHQKAVFGLARQRCRAPAQRQRQRLLLLLLLNPLLLT
jgi:hypothetical protein